MSRSRSSGMRRISTGALVPVAGRVSGLSRGLVRVVSGGELVPVAAFLRLFDDVGGLDEDLLLAPRRNGRVWIANGVWRRGYPGISWLGGRSSAVAIGERFGWGLVQAW